MTWKVQFTTIEVKVNSGKYQLKEAHQPVTTSTVRNYVLHITSTSAWGAPTSIAPFVN
uniref:Uncharacterized protein n=1 Tax=Setaria italica TaxID=4555 RepID=K3XP69_SETIT